MVLLFFYFFSVILVFVYSGRFLVLDIFLGSKLFFLNKI